MRTIKGTLKELAALREEIESKLGYPKQPDFVGKNVRNPVPTSHAYDLRQAGDKYEMTTDSTLELIAMDDHEVKIDGAELLFSKLAESLVEERLAEPELIESVKS